MEAVLKNLESTTELLAVAQTEMVKEWDKQTLERAFQWTRYCEHLYSRFHTNSSISKVMEKQLQVTNESLRTAFKEHTGVTFSDLSQYQHLLLVRLLKNPTLPSSIIEILFGTHSPLNTNRKEPPGASGHYNQLIECKSACKVLGGIHVRSTSVLGPDAEVQGMLLIERLDALLCQGSKAGIAESFLDSILQICEGVDDICSVIAAALLTRKNKKTAEDVSEDFLLDWLQQKDSLLQKMCATLPTGHLTDLAQQNMKFSVVYCNILKKWASDMEYDLNEGEWVQPSSTNIRIPYQMLAEHFLALFEACPSLKEGTVEELNILKISDGDFDARGLSIWGDLLSELKK